RAPRRATTPAVAKNVNGVVITSSPGPMPSAINATSSASVPDETPIPCAHREYAATSASSRSTWGPSTKCCDSHTSAMTASTSVRIAAYWAFRSSSGTFIKQGFSSSGRPQHAGFVAIPRGAAAAGRFGTVGRSGRQTELLAARAAPAAQPRGVPVDDRVVWHIPGDDGTRADEGIAPERHAADHRRVRADRRAALHEGRAVLV